MFQQNRPYVQTRHAAALAAKKTNENAANGENIAPARLGKEKITSSKVGATRPLGEQKNSITTNNITNGTKATRNHSVHVKPSNDENNIKAANIPMKNGKVPALPGDKQGKAKAGGKALAAKDNKQNKANPSAKPVLKAQQANKPEPKSNIPTRVKSKPIVPDENTNPVTTRSTRGQQAVERKASRAVLAPIEVPVEPEAEPTAPRKHGYVEEAVEEQITKKAKTFEQVELDQAEYVEPHPEPEPGWDDLDADDDADPMMASEYVVDIFKYMRELELTTMPSATYIRGQPEMTWKMRAILVDWMAEIHYKFHFVQETLFLAINILDRFLTLRVCALKKLQLVGLAALFIAAKYEETFCPLVRNLLETADDGFTEEDVVNAERYVLQVLDFGLHYPNPLNFLRRASKAENYDSTTRTLAKYLIEVAHIEHRCLQYPPSQISAAALLLARTMLRRQESWTPNLARYSGYEWEDLEVVSATILDALHTNFGMYEMIRHKYNSKRFMKASAFVDKWLLDRGYIRQDQVDQLEEEYKRQYGDGQE